MTVALGADVEVGDKDLVCEPIPDPRMLMVERSHGAATQLAFDFEVLTFVQDADALIAAAKRRFTLIHSAGAIAACRHDLVAAGRRG